MQTRQFHESSVVVAADPFSGNLVRANGALCADGKRRNAFPSHDGYGDTFFSIPAFVYVGKTRVYGFITYEAMSGSSVPTEDDPLTVRFIAYKYRKNHKLVEGSNDNCN